jgi:hypothetical protein
MNRRGCAPRGRRTVGNAIRTHVRVQPHAWYSDTLGTQHRPTGQRLGLDAPWTRARGRGTCPSAAAPPWS